MDTNNFFNATPFSDNLDNSNFSCEGGRDFSFSLKGPGVDDPGKVEIEFPADPDRGECQLPDSFYQIKKYCS